jgi:hypothetical protein
MSMLLDLKCRLGMLRIVSASAVSQRWSLLCWLLNRRALRSSRKFMLQGIAAEVTFVEQFAAG